jgi:hypothetical protein
VDEVVKVVILSEAKDLLLKHATSPGLREERDAKADPSLRSG